MDPVLRTAALAGCCGIRNTGAPWRAPHAFGTGAGTGGGDAASDLPDGATDAGVIDSAGVGTDPLALFALLDPGSPSTDPLPDETARLDGAGASGAGTNGGELDADEPTVPQANGVGAAACFTPRSAAGPRGGDATAE